MEIDEDDDTCNEYKELDIIYCSECFDEIIGVSNMQYYAVFVCSRSYTVSYPCLAHKIRVKEAYTFPLEKPDINILFYMKYGSIALYIKELFPRMNVHITCSRSILKIIKSMIKYTDNCHSDHTITIDRDSLIIDNKHITFWETSVVDFIPRHIIIDAIKCTKPSCYILCNICDVKNRCLRDSIFFNVYEF
uniref:Uncharacterized protein n=1 Tax=viral metagenome TaxID=1070528 RepID=A0A6C0BG27_9ZZZZ